MTSALWMSRHLPGRIAALGHSPTLARCLRRSASCRITRTRRDQLKSGSPSRQCSRSKIGVGFGNLAYGVPFSQPKTLLGKENSRRFSGGTSRREMSALPPKADICQRIEHVCFVPIADFGSAMQSSWPVARLEDLPEPHRITERDHRKANGAGKDPRPLHHLPLHLCGVV